jgi:hypothetical protein
VTRTPWRPPAWLIAALWALSSALGLAACSIDPGVNSAFGCERAIALRLVLRSQRPFQEDGRIRDQERRHYRCRP